MNSLPNPFTPGFGQVPYRLAGRERIIGDIVRALDLDYRDPSLTSILIGARGTGKTSLLSFLGSEAKQRDWVVVDSVAREGVLDDVFQRGVEAAALFLDPPASKRLTSLKIGAIGAVGWENAPLAEQNWRGKMNVLLDGLAEQGKGLLITIDEVDPTIPDVAELIATYQLFVREERRVALLLAGLPGKILALLNKKDITFIRRAKQYRLGSIPRSSVIEAFTETVTMGGRSIGAEALGAAVDAIDGFAYMMQAVGYRSWDQGEQSEIGIDDVRSGIAIANEEMKDSVLESTYLDLSKGDKAFLFAMLEDGSESALVDIASRTGRSNNSLQKTRKRLIDLGVIGERGRGYVAFELPFFKTFLKERLDC